MSHFNSLRSRRTGICTGHCGMGNPSAPRWQMAILALAVVLLCNAGAFASTLTPGYGTWTVFTGGDSGEGLDLDGNITHAFDFGATSGTLAIRDATFVSPESNPNVVISSHGNLAYHTVNTGNGNMIAMDYGSSANDNALESLLNTASYSGNWNFDLKVTQGQLYQLQVFLMEPYYLMQGGNLRNFDVLHETTPASGTAGNSVIIDDFVSGLEANGEGQAGPDFGYVYTYQFTAQDNFFNIQLIDSPNGTDGNAPLGAVTLEAITITAPELAVPEPATTALLLIGLPVLLRHRSRNRACCIST